MPAAWARTPLPPPPPGNPDWHEQFPCRSYIEFAAEDAAAPAARYRLRDDLARWRLRIDADDAQLVTGELVANAVHATNATAWRPARPPVRLWAIGGANILFILTWDATTLTPRLAAPGTLDESGRGLQIVDALSEWATTTRPVNTPARSPGHDSPSPPLIPPESPGPLTAEAALNHPRPQPSWKNTREGHPMQTATIDALFTFERASLERLKLAADVILAEGENIGDALTAELAIFRERVEHALLLPACTS
jgi:hypothetical protein